MTKSRNLLAKRKHWTPIVQHTKGHGLLAQWVHNK